MASIVRGNRPEATTSSTVREVRARKLAHRNRPPPSPVEPCAVRPFRLDQALKGGCRRGPEAGALPLPGPSRKVTQPAGIVPEIPQGRSSFHISGGHVPALAPCPRPSPCSPIRTAESNFRRGLSPRQRQFPRSGRRLATVSAAPLREGAGETLWRAEDHPTRWGPTRPKTLLSRKRPP